MMKTVQLDPLFGLLYKVYYQIFLKENNVMDLTVKNRLELFTKKVLDSVYRWNTDDVSVTCAKIIYDNNVKRTTQAVIDEAIENKRAGNYSSSINLYLDVLEATASITGGKISPFTTRSMCKSLIVANEYTIAFLLLNDCFRALVDVLNLLDANGQKTVNLIFSDLIAIYDDCIDSVLSDDFTKLLYITTQCSGSQSYNFVLSKTEISNQFKAISSMENYAKRFKR